MTSVTVTSEHVSLVAKRERLISGWVQVLVQENA
jgi:hypothetical protein